MWNQPRDCGRKTRRDYLKIPRSVTRRGKPRSRTRGTCEKVEYYWRAELSIRHRWPWVIGGLARTELAIFLHGRISLSCCARSINPRGYRTHFYGDIDESSVMDNLESTCRIPSFPSEGEGANNISFWELRDNYIESVIAPISSLDKLIIYSYRDIIYS